MKTYDEKGVFQSNEEELLGKKEFESFEKTAKNPKELKYRMAQGIDGLKEYDLISSEDENHLDGYQEKRFVMLDRCFFQDYIDAAKNENAKSFYVSYIDDEDIKKGIYPQKLSALLKSRGVYIEEVVPRILNYFGVYTVFNKKIQVGNEAYLLSLDCIKPNRKLIPLRVGISVFSSDEVEIEESLKKLEERIKNMVEEIKYDYKVSGVAYDIDQIKREYIKSYLIRDLLLDDSDFSDSCNYGIIYNEQEKKFENTLNFDFECIGVYVSGRTYWSETSKTEILKNLKFIKENYSDIYEEFKKKLKEFARLDAGLWDKVYEKLITNNKREKTSEEEQICKRIKKNLDYVDYFIEKLENQQQMS